MARSSTRRCWISSCPTDLPSARRASGRGGPERSPAAWHTPWGGRRLEGLSVEQPAGQREDEQNAGTGCHGDTTELLHPWFLHGEFAQVSEERRVGKELVGPFRSRCSP